MLLEHKKQHTIRLTYVTVHIGTYFGAHFENQRVHTEISSYTGLPFTQVGLAWVDPRLLFNNIFDWDVRRSVKVNL